MLQKHTVSFVALSDVLNALGVADIYDVGDPFVGVSFGDASHTLMPLPWVLDAVSGFIEANAEYMEVDDAKFSDAAHELLGEHTFVDMES